MNIPMLASSEGNFRAGRDGKKIEYIVVHYTANNGDAARGNAQYFSRTNVTASAHYFVDENEVVQSVHERDTAWHCGASTYRHPLCRNNNSLGVELCSRKDPDDNYYFMAATVDNAVALVKELMRKHGVPADHVLRHFDVTGKKCPAPFVGSFPSAAGGGRSEEKELAAKRGIATGGSKTTISQRGNAAWEAFKARLAQKEESMSYEEFKAYMARYEAEKAAMPPDAWSVGDRAWAEWGGIITGDAGGNKRYKSNVTREELAAVAHRLADLRE